MYSIILFKCFYEKHGHFRGIIYSLKDLKNIFSDYCFYL